MGEPETDKIDIGKDYLTISDEEGEVVHWAMDEWVEDPALVLSIANAVRIAAAGRSVRAYLKKHIGE